MPIPRMTIHRYDSKDRSLLTLAGQIDLASAPRLRETLRECLRDGIRHVDVDLTAVDFCDCTGLNAFLAAAHHATGAGATLRLHHPQPMLERLLALTGTGFLLGGPPATLVRPPPPNDLVGCAAARRSPALSGSAL